MGSANEVLVELFTEVFEGMAPTAEGTWFVQGDEALEDTLDLVSAHQASLSVGPGISTIAAHVIHAAYFLELANDGARGIEREGDWAGSWAKQQVSEEEWEAAQVKLSREKMLFLEVLSSFDFSNTENLSHAVANIGHIAYHLGAIRQLFLVGRSSAER